MAVELKDVPAWGSLRSYKTAHVLVWAEADGWCQTLCGTIASGHKRHKGDALPEVICRECRRLLKEDSVCLGK